MRCRNLSWVLVRLKSFEVFMESIKFNFRLKYVRVRVSKGQEQKRPRGSSSSVGEDDSNILESLSHVQDGIENGFTKMNTEMEALRCQMKGDIESI